MATWVSVLDGGGPKDSENTLSSFLTKRDRNVFWQIGVDIVASTWNTICNLAAKGRREGTFIKKGQDPSLVQQRINPAGLPVTSSDEDEGGGNYNYMKGGGKGVEAINSLTNNPTRTAYPPSENSNNHNRCFLSIIFWDLLFSYFFRHGKEELTLQERIEVDRLSLLVKVLDGGPFSNLAPIKTGRRQGSGSPRV